LIKSPSGKELFRPLAIFHGIFIGTPKQSKYLTTCCGLEVQNPTKALKSVKGSDNTIGLNPKCERSWPYFGNFSWYIYRVPQNPNNKVDI